MILLPYIHVFSVPYTSQMLGNNISEPDRQFLSQWAHSGYYIVVWFTNYMHVHILMWLAVLHAGGSQAGWFLVLSELI